MIVYVVVHNRIVEGIYSTSEEAQDKSSKMEGDLYIVMKNLDDLVGHYYEDAL